MKVPTRPPRALAAVDVDLIDFVRGQREELHGHGAEPSMRMNMVELAIS